MFSFICPICRKPLESDGRACRCESGHSYDLARSGWVNLLVGKQSGQKRHGDDGMMIAARSAFLGKGWYKPLLDAIGDMLEGRAEQGMSILDAGCGDGWYLAGLLERLAGQGLTVGALGVDISRDAVKASARRLPDAGFAVASVADLPLDNGSCDLVLSIFAPDSTAEFRRVLHRGGLYLRVSPLERHLFALKQAVYDLPRENPPEQFEPEGFRLLDSAEVRYGMALDSGEDIRALFAMTPYYYKTSAADQHKLDGLEELAVQAEFRVALYEKE